MYLSFLSMYNLDGSFKFREGRLLPREVGKYSIVNDKTTACLDLWSTFFLPMKVKPGKIYVVLLKIQKSNRKRWLD